MLRLEARDFRSKAEDLAFVVLDFTELLVVVVSEHPAVVKDPLFARDPVFFSARNLTLEILADIMQRFVCCTEFILELESDPLSFRKLKTKLEELVVAALLRCTSTRRSR